MGGTVHEVERELEHGRVEWKVEITGGDGNTYDVRVDAETGEITRIDADGRDDSGRDDDGGSGHHGGDDDGDDMGTTTVDAAAAVTTTVAAMVETAADTAATTTDSEIACGM